MSKAYHGKYERPIHWGDSKTKSWFQQAMTVAYGVFCMTVVGLILAFVVGAICMMVGG